MRISLLLTVGSILVAATCRLRYTGPAARQLQRQYPCARTERASGEGHSTLLKEEGYDALKAGDGESGLLKALSEPDLVLLDIRLPKMDGLAAPFALEPLDRYSRFAAIGLPATAAKAYQDLADHQAFRRDRM